MMGSGKSAIGRILAAKMNWHFIDLDREIEHAAGKPINEIFENESESAFRDLEKKVSRQLKPDKCIISTGGGFPVNAENRRWMRDNGLIVWLDVSPEVIFQRVKHRRHRPILKNNMNIEFISDLLDKRRAFYADSHIRINADPDDIEAKTELIIKKVLDAQDQN